MKRVEKDREAMKSAEGKKRILGNSLYKPALLVHTAYVLCESKLSLREASSVAIRCQA